MATTTIFAYSPRKYLYLYKFFSMQDVTRENKLRLLMIYAATHPEKLEGDKMAKLMEVFTFSFNKSWLNCLFGFDVEWLPLISKLMCGLKQEHFSIKIC